MYERRHTSCRPRTCCACTRTPRRDRALAIRRLGAELQVEGEPSVRGGTAGGGRGSRDLASRRPGAGRPGSSEPPTRGRVARGRRAAGRGGVAGELVSHAALRPRRRCGQTGRRRRSALKGLAR